MCIFPEAFEVVVFRNCLVLAATTLFSYCGWFGEVWKLLDTMAAGDSSIALVRAKDSVSNEEEKPLRDCDLARAGDSVSNAEESLPVDCDPGRAEDSVSDAEEHHPQKDTDGGDKELDPHRWRQLQPDILVKIVARLPLKSLLQARVLSKEWNAKIFSSPTFQKEVTSVSSAWSTYCPLYMLRGNLIGYDSLANEWQKIFTHHGLPYEPGGISPYANSTGAGSLVCVASEDEGLSVETMYDRRWIHQLKYELSVTNLVLGKTRKLPPRPNMERPHIMHVLPVGAQSYKVILVTQLGLTSGPDEAPMCTQIYDSTSKSWTMKLSFALPLTDVDVWNHVYLDGVIYIVIMDGVDASMYRVAAYNVDRGTWITTVPKPLPQRGYSCKLYLCGSEVMLVVKTAGDLRSSSPSPVYRTAHTEVKNKFHILKLDLVSLQASEVSRGPSEVVIDARFDDATACGDCIYFGDVPQTPLLVYNVRKQEWSRRSPASSTSFFRDSLWRVWSGVSYSIHPKHVPWGNFALQPGLNPFVEV